MHYGFFQFWSTRHQLQAHAVIWWSFMGPVHRRA